MLETRRAIVAGVLLEGEADMTLERYWRTERESAFSETRGSLCHEARMSRRPPPLPVPYRCSDFVCLV